MDRRKILVLATALIAVTLLGVGLFIRIHREPPPLVLQTQGFPTLGEATAEVEIVVFEDVRCTNCRQFSLEVYPQIYTHYIQSGKVRYTLIPLAFIHGSKFLTNAAWAVYRQFPDRFFSYVHALIEALQVGEVEEATLLQLAQKVGQIDLNELQEAIQSERYFEELDQNLAWTEQMLGESFVTPAIYVSGRPIAFPSWEAVRKKIDAELMQRKKNLSFWYQVKEPVFSRDFEEGVRR